jgi:hypothetical protein
MAQTKTTQIIAKSPWHEIYRELDEGAVRVAAKYVDRYDNAYSMRVVEVRGAVLNYGFSKKPHLKPHLFSDVLNRVE